MESLEFKNIEDIISKKKIKVSKKVCVFGQGFVGLPLTLSFAFRGCETIGVDVDSSLVNTINSGLTHHTEKFNNITIQDILQRQLRKKTYRATVDAENAVKRCNNIIITVGIPIKNNKYVMDHLANACKTIGKNLKKGDLVVVRSTVIPGTTEDFVMPILEQESSMKAGRDFYLAYASERIAEGNAFDEFTNMPTLVGAINEKSLNKAAQLLSIVCKAEIVKASCIRAVETSKVFENVQRDVNIAMVQEFARFTEAMGIDIFEVVRLANTHKRVNLLMPGSGVGGYCIPNAYYYIAPKAEKMDVDMPVLRIARRENSNMPEFIVNKVQELLVKQGKSIEYSQVAVLGLAMKDYSNDDRISPPVDICKILIERGAKVKAFDSVVPTKYDFKVDTRNEALSSSDAVLLLTKQKNIKFDDYEYISKIMNQKPVCIDCKHIVNIQEARKYGFICWEI